MTAHLLMTNSAAPVNAATMRDAIVHHLIYTVGEAERNATLSNWRVALSYAIRDQVVGPWFEARSQTKDRNLKQVYYLSMEFLIGRLLADAIVNLDLDTVVTEALGDLGLDYNAVVEDEPDAALGNGGLGRLAACFLDSMSTIGLPAMGYGIRYHHGLFKQRFNDGWQVEEAEDWLTQGRAWEFERVTTTFPIGFGGQVHEGDDGKMHWHPAETVAACAFDTPTPGWRGRWVNTLRLWEARATEVFDLEPFNRGDFIGAAKSNVLAETICRVLYPDETTPQGRELRLKQEYFFTAASLHDIVARFLDGHDDLSKLAERATIQMNDTHPAIAVPELVRILVDEHGMDFATAAGVCRQTLNYTNHTLMPEALEAWPMDMMACVLPRHMQIIEGLDALSLQELSDKGQDRPQSAAILDDGNVKMGNLAFIYSNRVNGVSGLHTDLMRETVFSDLNALFPEKILSQTNGVTPRRWLKCCNPGLSQLITDVVGEGWETDLDRIEGLLEKADDPDFRQSFRQAKRANKDRLAQYLNKKMGITVNPEAMFDIQIKRIHEYKRQLMNVLEVAALYNEIKRHPDRQWAPRVRIFGGKAAPGYVMAKQIIKLINDIADTINNDPETRDILQVVYPANYNVSMAEMLIPAADLSEQISTAGMEASGTGNMKFSMNGALTIGTLDGANVEICDRVGKENIFIFGQTADEVIQLREKGYDPASCIAASPALAEVVSQIASGVFSPGDPDRHHGIVENLNSHDWFMVAADFQAYFDTQRQVDAAWLDQETWCKRAVINTASMGWFSSDRTIRGYARDIWDITPAF